MRQTTSYALLRRSRHRGRWARHCPAPAQMSPAAAAVAVWAGAWPDRRWAIAGADQVDRVTTMIPAVASPARQDRWASSWRASCRRGRTTVGVGVLIVRALIARPRRQILQLVGVAELVRHYLAYRDLDRVLLLEGFVGVLITAVLLEPVIVERHLVTIALQPRLQEIDQRLIALRRERQTGV